MTEPNATDPDDMLAGEFVLGSLDGQERAAAMARQVADPAFAQLVAAWEQRLHPLSEAGQEASPPPQLWAAITSRLGWSDGGGGDHATVLMFQRALRRWRAGAAAATALAACLAGLVVWQARHPVAAPTLMAVLQKAGNDSAILLRANFEDRQMAVRAMEAAPPPGRAFELWMIEPSLGAPKSLGTLDATGPAGHPLPADVTPAVAHRATYAITIEPPGGAPDGKPSGSPIYTGHLLMEPF